MSKSTKSDRKEQYLKNRKTLIELSQVIRIGVKEGAFDSVNEGLKECYMKQNPDIDEFKTFQQWKQEGATVRRGEKAFLIWGQPRQVEQVPEGSNEPEEFKYWPLCYLFSNRQVYKPSDKDGQEQTEQEPELSEAVNGDDL